MLALQKASSSTDRIAATWYSYTNYSIDLNFTDGLSHQFALYNLDWDPASRAQTLTIKDASTNAVLDTRNISSFQNGLYVVWNVSGHVVLQITCTGGINAVVSGLFFDPVAGGGGGGNYVTTYSYDLLGHLSGVSMPRPTGTQTRTFNYGTPPGALLLSATNPENGTVTYTYNANQKVQTKTDAKGQQTQYSYDSYNRLTQVRHYPSGSSQPEDTCQQVNYFYDTDQSGSGFSNRTGRTAVGS